MKATVSQSLQPAGGSHPIRIVIADDHGLFRAGLKVLLQDEQDFQVVGELSDGEGVCEMVRERQADVLLLDLKMPRLDGEQTLRRLRGAGSEVRTIILSANSGLSARQIALQLGARGFVPKSAATLGLVQTIRRVYDGGLGVLSEGQRSWDAPGVQPKKKRRRAHSGPPTGAGNGWDDLTPRESQISLMVGSGKRYRKIAQELGISEQTVRNHLRNVFDKLQVRDRVQLAVYVHQLTG